ncbi:MAG: hypothetical protein R2764_23580 [Bacteroidales bacterium]
MWGLALGYQPKITSMGGKFLWNDAKETPEVLSSSIIIRKKTKLFSLKFVRGAPIPKKELPLETFSMATRVFWLLMVTINTSSTWAKNANPENRARMEEIGIGN